MLGLMRGGGDQKHEVQIQTDQLNLRQTNG